ASRTQQRREGKGEEREISRTKMTQLACATSFFHFPFAPHMSSDSKLGGGFVSIFSFDVHYVISLARYSTAGIFAEFGTGHVALHFPSTVGMTQ
ncbi:hypothetical protein PFISCL1PPCAC_28065, partial [Pristionchus fissidentatus]